MSNYITGEPMIPPSERELPLGAANIVNPTGPINYLLRQRCQKMDNAELEALIREAEIELARRKNERANKLIDKVCAALNELKDIGNVSFIFKCDEGYVHELLSETDVFTKEMFEVRKYV